MHSFVTLNRIFAAILVVIAAYWLWESIIYWHQISANKTFYDTSVAPGIAEMDRYTQALNDHSKGKLIPLPPIFATNNPPFMEWMDRVNATRQIGLERNYAELAFASILMVWIVVSSFISIGKYDFLKRRVSSPDRPAAPNAGKLIGELTDSRRVFAAKTEDISSARRVEIDGVRRRVVFHNFAFITAFFRNPKLERVELPLSDLLVGLIYYANGHPSLNLRTARGKVMIKDDVKPFPELVNLLLDAIELNRTNPIQYRETLAREPAVRTPWYGWAIIAIAVAAVGVVFYWVLQQ